MAGVVVPIDADITPLLAEFAKLPGRTQQEMDAVGKVIEGEITRGRIAQAFGELPGVSQKAAKKAGAMLSREMAKASADSQRSLGDLRRGAQSVFGGIVNDVDDMAQALGALPPAMGGIAVALGIVAGAAVGLYKASAATGALKEEQAALKQAGDEVVFLFGSVMPGAFETMILGAANLTKELGNTALGMRGVIEIGGSLYDQFTTQAALTIGMGTSALAGNREETQRWVAAYNASDGYIAAVTKGEEATAAWATAIKAAQYNATQWQGPKLPKGPAAPKSGGKSRPAAVAALLPSTDEAAEERAAYETFLGDISRMQYVHIAEMEAAKQAEAEADSARVAQEVADRRVATDAYLGAASDIAGAVGSVSGLLSDQAGISKEAAIALVVVQKAAAIAQIGVSTAVAVMGALAAFAATPPVAAAVAAGYIATGAAQAAIVAATPEAFHIGGLKGWAPDESMARVRSGEGVLTGQGVQAMGGAAGVAAANRGEAGGGAIRVVAQYQHRVFDSMIGDNIRMRSSPLHGALRDGKRAGVRRG